MNEKEYAAERLSGDITLGAMFIKRGNDSNEPDKVTSSLEEALMGVIIEWNE